jgi:octaheme c-type cytochrome (tetrathionate reductase family)
MKKLPLFILLAGQLCLLPVSMAAEHEQVEQTKAPKHESHSTADHSQFEILQQDFKSGPEVTEACLSCHTKAAHQVKQSLHWKWEYKHPQTGQELGKKNVINSFCGNVASNESRCTSCHVGYDWRDMSQPPPQEDNKVDCVVCHDKTGTYSKWPTHAGHPLYEPLTQKGKTHPAPNLSKVAQNVGLPERENCGSCHFYGGGGDNVKHGDLSSALIAPDKHTDVHMAADGLNFACTECHVSVDHQVEGSRYAVNTHDEGKTKPGQRRDVATCESCHTNKPHPDNTLAHIKLNNHTEKVACQTCHIPEFAKGGIATKTAWLWSEAGKMKDGKPYSEENYTQGNGQHRHTYMSKKGSFEFGEDVVPHYAWFDGQVEYNLQAEKIDPSKVVEVNKIHGSAEDPNAKIWPFKRMQGSQPYDKVNNTLVTTQVWGSDTETAYWTNFDWTKAIQTGMNAIGADFSGEHGFVNTYMYWPITHMVSPKDEALGCADCHSENSRLAGIEGIYMPGQSTNPWLTRLGLLAVVMTLLGVIGHGVMRKVFNKGDKS